MGPPHRWRSAPAGVLLAPLHRKIPFFVHFAKFAICSENQRKTYLNTPVPSLELIIRLLLSSFHLLTLIYHLRSINHRWSHHTDYTLSVFVWLNASLIWVSEHARLAKSLNQQSRTSLVFHPGQYCSPSWSIIRPTLSLPPIAQLSAIMIAHCYMNPLVSLISDVTLSLGPAYFGRQ